MFDDYVSGKSTAIGILAGLIRQTSGTVSVFGRRHATCTSACFQSDILVPSLTIRESLEYFGEIMGIPPKDREAGAIELGLASKLNSPVGTLSGGNKRKVAVSIAMLSDAPLILLDEPTAGNTALYALACYS